INLRNWRHKADTGSDVLKTLECNIKISLQHILKKAAAWATILKCRLHFEWVWDGKHIYLVQADTEKSTGTFDPVKSVNQRSKQLTTFSPKALSKISVVHGRKYHKIHNVLAYIELGLPTTNLYVLDDRAIIQEISNGLINPALSHDIEQL